MKSRPKILAAAISEFAEKGYEGATTAGIARRAKTVQPLVHHHFGSKAALFRAVVDSLFEELKGTGILEASGPDDAIGLVQRLVDFTARRPELARIWIVEAARRSPQSEYVLERHIGPLTRAVRPRLLGAARRGLFPGIDANFLLYAILGMASYPFLAPEHVRGMSGADAHSPRFAQRYAEALRRLLKHPVPRAPGAPRPAAGRAVGQGPRPSPPGVTKTRRSPGVGVAGQ
jgi:TetR/AcrR family transcriptional regulator